METPMKFKVIAYTFAAVFLVVSIAAVVAYVSLPVDSPLGPVSIEAAETWVDLTPPSAPYLSRGYQSWLKGSTAISVAYNPGAAYVSGIDMATVWYETASDVWTMTGTYTLSDAVGSDGVLDTIAITAIGGATAGGKYIIQYWNYGRI